MNKDKQHGVRCEKSAESVERRGLAKGNTRRQATAGTQSPGLVKIGLKGVREAARRDKRLQLTALLHHIDVELLHKSYLSLKREAAAGIDGLTWKDYQRNTIERLEQLCEKLHQGNYRALPSKRTYISKQDGSRRGLGISALEDKIVHHATSEVLNAIYEEDFLGFSYGFRKGRDQHQALDALYVGLTQKSINWVVDLDVKGFFDHLDHEWVLEFVKHRIADKRILKLIRHWLTVGAMEDGRWEPADKGSPQGAVISSLLANIYLHYSFDLWVQRRRCKRVRGDMIVVRYADDIIAGFEHEEEAKDFMQEVQARLSSFGLSLHPDKTRLLEYGMGAVDRAQQEGRGKPESFDFLGFTHIASKSRKGRYVIRRQTISKRKRNKLQELKEELRERMHDPVSKTGQWLRQVLQGYYRYFAVPYNIGSLAKFHYELSRVWLHTLRRRSQKAAKLKWETFRTKIRDYWLPRPRVLHPWPNVRFAANTQSRSRMR